MGSLAHLCTLNNQGFGHYSVGLRCFHLPLCFHLLLLLHRHRVIYRFVPRIQVEAKWNVTTLINTSWGMPCSIMLLNSTQIAHGCPSIFYGLGLDLVPWKNTWYSVVLELLACRLPVFVTDSLRFPQTSLEWNSCSPACCAAGKTSISVRIED